MATNLNPLLIEALRSRAASAADPALHALLSDLDPVSGASSLPSTQELLSQLESTNPNLGLISKYFAARQASESEKTSADDSDAEEQRLAIERSERLARIVQRLEQHVKKLRAELEQLRERNDTLAAAVGACYLCWGGDPACPICHGKGLPGSMIPEQQSFEQFVRPAIRTLQTKRGANGSNPSKTEQ